MAGFIALFFSLALGSPQNAPVLAAQVQCQKLNNFLIHQGQIEVYLDSQHSQSLYKNKDTCPQKQMAVAAYLATADSAYCRVGVICQPAEYPTRRAKTLFVAPDADPAISVGIPLP